MCIIETVLIDLKLISCLLIEICFIENDMNIAWTPLPLTSMNIHGFSSPLCVCVNWQLGVAKGDNPLSPFPIILSSFPSPFHLSCPLSPVPPLIPTLSAQRCLFELSDTIVALFQPPAAISFKITGKLASHRERLRRRLDNPHGVPVFARGSEIACVSAACSCDFSFSPAYSLSERWYNLIHANWRAGWPPDNVIQNLHSNPPVRLGFVRLWCVILCDGGP